MFRLTQKKLGFFYGLLSSATYGLIPLFTLPLLEAGVNVETALVYRFGIAALIMGAILIVTKEKILMPAKQMIKLVALSVLYMIEVLLFFHAFRYLPSGIVVTINFQYPVLVMLIMSFFFHERFRWQIGIAVALTILGVALLSLGPFGEPDASIESHSAHRVLIGVILALLAALTNAIYYVGIQVARLPKIDGLVMTFYIMLTGAIFCTCNAFFLGKLEWISSSWEIGVAVLLALVTAVISNLTLILAIKRIGSTITSILGVMEPLTAVGVGWLVFGEHLTIQLAIGAMLIVIAVLLVLEAPQKHPR